MTYPYRAARLLHPLLAIAFALTATLANAKPLPPVEGEVIVAFKTDASMLRKHALSARADAGAVSTTLADRASTLGARVGRTLQAGVAVGDRVQVMRAAGVDATTLARQLSADPDVAYAVPNGRKRIVTAPNDPLYAATAAGVRANGPDSGQWYLRAPDGSNSLNSLKSAINIEGAWARTTGGGNVVVAVLDTGVRFDHPDLTRRLLRGHDFVSDSDVGNDGDGRDADPTDPGDWTTATENSTAGGKFYKCDPQGTGAAAGSASSWHGTTTASLVGAATNTSPATGMAGAAPGTRILPVRVLGKCFGSDADILAAMRWAAGLAVPGVAANPTPAKVINMSLGGDGVCGAAYQAAVDDITAQGVTIVAAAGNTAGGPVGEPANCRGVIGVLALRHAGTKVGFSDLGPEITISAPGGNCVNITAGSPCLFPILAATNTGAQGPASSAWSDSFNITLGTSFSSPLVAGVVALMVSRQASLTPPQVRSTLQSTARPFPTTGAATPGETVPQCRAPASGVEQLQCYCNTTLCGAGMLDAAAAVAAVATTPFVSITSDPAAPVAGEAVAFSITGLQTQATGAPSYAWALVDGGGAANGFSTAANADTASITPQGSGTMRVRLTVTDALGGSSSTEQFVAVAAAAPVVPPPSTGGGGSGGGGGGGGGAASWAWVAGVGLAAAVLQALRRQQLKALQRRA